MPYIIWVSCPEPLSRWAAGTVQDYYAEKPQIPQGWYFLVKKD